MDKFIELVKKENIALNEEMLDKFSVYYQELLKANEHINLTAITEKEEVYLKHFYDSLCLLKATKEIHTLLDVGSGAGFPSIPVKIVDESVDITIVDSLQKRINFLKELTDKLNIRAELIHSRIEDFKLKNYFDVVTARAVSKLNVLVEYCLPFVKVGGVFVAMKGPNTLDEIKGSEKAILLLGGKLKEVMTYETPYGDRTLIVIEKIKKVNGYPRTAAQIKNNPL